MVDERKFLKEIRAYALKASLEYGKADPGKVLAKLFRHGLLKTEIKEIMPEIQKIVKEVSSLSVEKKEASFERSKEHVMEGDPENHELPELPNVKGKPRFRIAPFPSGALHIGNAKTFLLNALYAEKYSGEIVLVMDDTIGSVEKPIDKESYKLIEDAFKWMGIKYKKKVYYKSDRLNIYYKYAEELIKKNRAYVCQCSREELQSNRRSGIECSCRQFPEKIQLERWKEMFKMKEGHAVLRLKTDMMHPNPAFRDRVLFKISDREHARVGKKYRVWPTLEMSWAIDDHLLGITHIIRGNDLMIESDMERFIWKIFKWGEPEIIHTGLVKIEGLDAKISKSKAGKEVRSGEFTGWDDPRTWSIQSLKRRGLKKEALREFVEELGLNKQDTKVPIEALYSINRKMIDLKSDRYSFIENPVQLKIGNKMPVKSVKIPRHPERDEMRVIKIKDLFISQKDFKESKGNEVRLLHLYNVKLSGKDNAEISSIENKKIPKINWVSPYVPTRILGENGQWISGIADSAIKNLKKGEIIQFERFGFVKFDGKSKGIYEFWLTHR